MRGKTAGEAYVCPLKCAHVCWSRKAGSGAWQYSYVRTYLLGVGHLLFAFKIVSNFFKGFFISHEYDAVRPDAMRRDASKEGGIAQNRKTNVSIFRFFSYIMLSMQHGFLIGSHPRALLL